MKKPHTPEYCRLWRLRNPNRKRWEILYAAKQRAKRKGLPFKLTLSDFIVPSVCPVLGIPIAHQTGRHQSDNSPSLDRLVPAKGYTKGNVMVISFRANRIKQNATVRELRLIARWMVKHGRQEN